MSARLYVCTYSALASKPLNLFCYQIHTKLVFWIKTETRQIMLTLNPNFNQQASKNSFILYKNTALTISFLQY